MSKQITESAVAVRTETERRGALVLRTLPVLFIPGILGVITAALLRATMGADPSLTTTAAEPRPFPLVPIVASAIFLISLVVLVRLGRPTLSALALIFSWTLMTTLFSLYFGITTFTPALLVIPICVAGLLIDGAASVSLAGLASILIVSIAWMQMNGLTFEHERATALMTGSLPIAAAGFWTGLFWTVAALTSLLAGSLQRALKQSQSQAEALSQLSAQLEARVESQTAALLSQSREAAILEERTRLAREIHDTLAQGLTGVVVQLAAAQRAISTAPDEGQTHLALAHRMARESLAEARRSVWNLRSPALERGDLGDALRSLAERPLHPETRVRFVQNGTPWSLAPGVESALLRVCQEALVNVAKHARASQADVLLDYSPDAVMLKIIDNGVGFRSDITAIDPTNPGPWSGFGLLGMRERVAALGGTMQLVNSGGAQVRVLVPRAGNEVSTTQPPMLATNAEGQRA